LLRFAWPDASIIRREAQSSHSVLYDAATEMRAANLRLSSSPDRTRTRIPLVIVEFSIFTFLLDFPSISLTMMIVYDC
jgi:hypothetical protein